MEFPTFLCKNINTSYYYKPYYQQAYPISRDSYELVIQIRTSREMTNKHYIHSDQYERSTALTRVKKSANPGTKKKVK